MKKLILLPILALVLSACDALDAPKNMVSMKETTEGMSEKMSQTNESIRLQKVAVALEMINDSKNQENLLPVPTGLLPGGKLFAETASTKEIIDYTYLILKQLEEVVPTKGLDKDGAPIALTEAELATVRQQKLAQLYGLMIIATYAQDAKVSAVIDQYIKGNDVRQKTGLALLAMRAYFIREVMLKASMKVDAGTAETLDNSGSMTEAINWLVKLDQVSKLKLKLPIAVKVQEKTQNLITFEELHDDDIRKETAKMWVMALSKAEEGVKSYNTNVTNPQEDTEELSKQNQAIVTMKTYVDSWSALLQ
ncbi:MAG: hypothetical protein ACXWC9_00100 [Pseudobdellovibrionaceae bacterium]